MKAGNNEGRDTETDRWELEEACSLMCKWIFSYTSLGIRAWLAGWFWIWQNEKRTRNERISHQFTWDSSCDSFVCVYLHKRTVGVSVCHKGIFMSREFFSIIRHGWKSAISSGIFSSSISQMVFSKIVNKNIRLKNSYYFPVEKKCNIKGFAIFL